MRKDSSPVTVADLLEFKTAFLDQLTAFQMEVKAFQTEVKTEFAGVRKDLAELKDTMNRQFDWHAEQLTKVLNRLDELDEDRVEVTAIADSLDDHERRLKRLERRRLLA